MITANTPRRRICCCLACAALLAAGADAQSPGALTLLAKGRSEYQIVLPDHCSDAALSNRLARAAGVLQAAFAANGCAVPVAPESARLPDRPAIFLGDTAKARAAGIDPSALADWGYALKAVGRDVVLAGKDEVVSVRPGDGKPSWEDRSAGRVRTGTLKGVADFLRQYAGVRFLYPTGEKSAPLDDTGLEFLKTPTVAVPADLNVRVNPTLLFNACYPLRESLYDIANNLFPQTGVRPGAHSHPDAVPASLYRESHPEYFALVKGRRCCETKDWTGGWSQQYCLSNPEVQALIYRQLLAQLDRGYETAGLGQADGFVPCECAACAALFGVGDDWGEKLWILHRNLAERLLKDRPGKRVLLLAYSHTKAPPKSFRTFPPNAVIQLCATNDGDFEQWSHVEVPGGFTAYIYNWGPYHPCGPFTPKRTPTYVEAQARRFATNHVRGIYRDGFGELFGLEGPVYYVYGRLYDDPEHLDARTLMDEFCTAAFGKAAAPMRRFYATLYAHLAPYSDQLGVGCPDWAYVDFEGRRRKYSEDNFQLIGFLYGAEALKALNEQLQLAEKAADSDKARRRLALVRTEFDYVRDLAVVAHLANAYLDVPDAGSRERLCAALDARSARIGACYDARGRMKPVAGWPEMVPFRDMPRAGLALQQDQYLSRFKDSPLGWDTKALRAAPLPTVRAAPDLPPGIDPP